MLAWLCAPTLGLTPLTMIEPSSEELAVFSTTLLGALAKVRGPGLEAPSIHVVGASRVEHLVDWSPICRDGARITLIGPQVEPLEKMVGSPVVPRHGLPGQECVTVLRGLYSRQFVLSALGDRHPGAVPDMAIAFNADVYMHYWRRTLAELLQARIPVVITCYCEYEGGEITRLLDAPAAAFSSSALAEGDAYIRKRYRGDADEHLTSALHAVPLAKTLWAFQPSPHAHLPPRSCLQDETGEYAHGVRNSFWMAFRGANEKEEL